jgi:hypothetical protein
MINVHLNGDIVRCPDIKEIHKRASEIRDKHKICIYNIHETTCRVWQSTHQNLNGLNIAECTGRCNLASSISCPGHIRQSNHARKQKIFRIDNKVYRKIASASHYMVKESEYKTIFITLTFPPFKIKPDEKQINQCFSRFAENLHKNYGVKYYIAVKEHCPTTGRPHFHHLLAIRFTDFSILNNAWCSAISDICESSPNALQTNKGKVIVRSPGRAMRYACKYFAKCRGAKSETRLIFMALPLILKPKNDYISVNDILKDYKSIYIQQTSDFTTCFRITDSKEFDRFCNLYLYALFELSSNKTDFTGVPGSFN